MTEVHYISIPSRYDKVLESPLFIVVLVSRRVEDVACSISSIETSSTSDGGGQISFIMTLY